jgi:hypothetical protein
MAIVGQSQLTSGVPLGAWGFALAAAQKDRHQLERVTTRTANLGHALIIAEGPQNLPLPPPTNQMPIRPSVNCTTTNIGNTGHIKSIECGVNEQLLYVNF